MVSLGCGRWCAASRRRSARSCRRGRTGGTARRRRRWAAIAIAAATVIGFVVVARRAVARGRSRRGRRCSLAAWRCSWSVSSTIDFSSHRSPSWLRRSRSARSSSSCSPASSPTARCRTRTRSSPRSGLPACVTRSTCSTTWTGSPLEWRSSPTVFLAALLGRVARCRRSCCCWSSLAGALPVFSTGTARGAAVHGRLRQPVHRRDARRRVTRSRVPPRIAFVSPTVLVVLILIVPLFDTGVRAGAAATRRTQALRKGGTDHVSHRLVSLGFSERSAVRILYLLGLLGGLSAWSWCTRTTIEPMLAGGASSRCSSCSSASTWLVCPAYNAEDFMALQKSSFAPFLKDLAFKWHVGEVMLDLVLITVCYYAALSSAFRRRRTPQFPSVFHGSLPLVLGASLRRSTAPGCTSVRGRRSACATSPPSHVASAWDRCCTVAVGVLSYRGRACRESCSSSMGCC